MIKIAFYKAPKGNFFGSLISGWTSIWSRNTPAYSHVEIGIPNEKGKYKWYSSASRNIDGTTGTRWIDESVLFKHPERWDVYNVVNYRHNKDMLKTCTDECGKPYDWIGIAGFAIPFGNLNFKSQWYCSEICHYIFFGKWKKRISPKGFYKKIKGFIVIEKEII